MARKTYSCGGKGRYSRGGGGGACTMCGRVHPKGKKQKAKARAKGWESCASVAMRKKLSRDR